MDTFEIVVLSIAIMLLVIILGVFVYFMTNVAKSTEWPPVVSNCPDFWENQIYKDGDISRNICVDVNDTIDPKCKTFAGQATVTGSAIDAGQFLYQDGKDGVTMNKYLVYKDGNTDSSPYVYSGYNDDGEHQPAGGSSEAWTNFQAFYALDVSGQHGSTSPGYTTASYTSIDTFGGTSIGSDNLARINTNSGNKIHVSFNLSDTDSETARDLTKDKRTWATNCGVSWDGITS
jgi:hypothetical protein